MPALRILIVEDSADDAALMLLELSRGGLAADWRRVETADEMRSALAEGPWDVVLADNSLPDFGAAQSLAILRAADHILPLIVVSGTIGDQRAVELMRAGAGDYVLKGNLSRLAPAIEREVKEAKSRRALRLAEEAASLLAAVVESSDDAILSTTLAGVFTSWNPAAERLYGWTAGEAVGRHVSFIVPPDRAEELSWITQGLGRGERVEPFETVRLRKDGTRVEVSVTVSPVRGGDGRLIGVSKIARDISARRRAEAEGQRAFNLLRAVVEGIPDAVFVKDREGKYLLCNESAARFAGRTAAEVLGSDDTAVFDPDSARECIAQARRVMATRQAETAEETLTAAGVTRTYLATTAPYLDESGAVLGVVGIAHDVTRQRALEGQFRQAQKMEAFGQLAGGVAHDFNNLLTVINGYSELLIQRLPPGDPSAEFLREINIAGERSASLTRQLLVFSRKQVVVPRILDLNRVIADTERMLQRVIGEDVRLATSLAGGLGSVRADEGLLQQVLMNLVVNARDAMPQGGKLTIETRNVELDEAHARVHAGVAPGPFVLLAVSDTGCGMTAEVKGHLFEPFFTTKGVGKGTGLGLATVYGIVKQADGHVVVHSEVGVGTSFEVYLPRSDQPARAGSSLSGIKAPPRGTETVLLVEDDDGVRSLTRHMLQNFGYTVLEASGGAAALRVAGEHAGPIHLLITDVVMPGMSGRQVAVGVAGLHPEARVLYTSGYTDDAVVRHGILHADVYFLPKPFSPLALAYKVREVLDPPGPGDA
jgi:two-component system cell cycle sensor histidine kinase/response regulator CckA